MIRSVFMLSLVLVFLSSCEKKKEDKTSSTPDLDGTWATACIVSNTDSERKTLVVSDGAMTFTINQYSGTTVCLADNLNLTFTLTSTLTATGDSSTITGAKEFQMTLNSFTLTPANTGVTAAMVSGSTCGATDWVINTPKSIFGCTTFSMGNLSSSTIHYDVYKIDTSVTPNQFNMGVGCAVTGDAGFCTTSGSRPTALDTGTSETFIKQ